MPQITHDDKGGILKIDGLEVVSGPYDTEEELSRETDQMAETWAIRMKRPFFWESRVVAGKFYAVNTC